jgi:hypothetical protein
MSLSPSDRRALTRHRAVLHAKRAAASALLVRAWDSQEDRDASGVDEWLSRTAPILAGAQVATVAASAAFYARLLRTSVPGINPADIVPDTNPRDPFLSYWHALNMDRPWDEAIAAGRSTAAAVGDTHVTVVDRLTGDHVATATDRAVRWQRVAEPRACDWCNARDGGVYPSSADGNFGHDNCHCNVVPV